MTSSDEPSNPGGIGGKIRGAGQVVHGLGEVIRGEALHLVDSASSNTRYQEASERATSIAEQGRQELQAGLSSIKGRPADGSGSGTEPSWAHDDKEPQGGRTAAGSGDGGDTAYPTPTSKEEKQGAEPAAPRLYQSDTGTGMQEKQDRPPARQAKSSGPSDSAGSGGQQAQQGEIGRRGSGSGSGPDTGDLKDRDGGVAAESATGIQEKQDRPPARQAKSSGPSDYAGSEAQRGEIGRQGSGSGSGPETGDLKDRDESAPTQEFRGRSMSNNW